MDDAHIAARGSFDIPTHAEAFQSDAAIGVGSRFAF